MTQSKRFQRPLWQVGLVVLVALALVVAYTWAFRSQFTSQVPGANDFFSRWAGTRLYLTRGWDPYGDQTSLWIQNAIWGHPAGPDEDPSLFAYPFYTVFLVAPYALLGDYSWAQAAWQVTLQGTALAALILTLTYHRWWPRPVLLGALLFWMLGFYPTARSIILGQIGLLVFALTVWALWLVMRPDSTPSPAKDGLAGVLLAITTVKPQMQFLIVPFVLLWALRERRWQIIAGFGLALAALLALSFALLPDWVGKWLAQVRLYPSYTPPAVLFIFTREVLPLGAAAGPVERGLGVVLVLYLLVEWWGVLSAGNEQKNEARLAWVVGLTLVITHLVAPRTATTHFVVFVFPLIAVLRDLSRRKPWGGWAALALMLMVTAGMWWLFLGTLEGAQEHNLVHVPLPLLMLLLLLLTRPSGEPGGHPVEPSASPV
jgi:hypothetical protein